MHLLMCVDVCVNVLLRRVVLRCMCAVTREVAVAALVEEGSSCGKIFSPDIQ